MTEFKINRPNVAEGCDYGKAINLIEKGTVANIANCIDGDIYTWSEYHLSTHSGHFNEENEIADIIIRMVARSSQSFTKDICQKLIDRYEKMQEAYEKKYPLSFTPKQHWAIAYDIVNNREYYKNAIYDYISNELKSIDSPKDVDYDSED